MSASLEVQADGFRLHLEKRRLLLTQPKKTTTVFLSARCIGLYWSKDDAMEKSTQSGNLAENQLQKQSTLS